jgi:hypothetical protein
MITKKFLFFLHSNYSLTVVVSIALEIVAAMPRLMIQQLPPLKPQLQMVILKAMNDLRDGEAGIVEDVAVAVVVVEVVIVVVQIPIIKIL